MTTPFRLKIDLNLYEPDRFAKRAVRLKPVAPVVRLPHGKWSARLRGTDESDDKRQEWLQPTRPPSVIA